MKGIWRDILLNTTTEKRKLKIKKKLAQGQKISYQTPILRFKNLLLRRKLKKIIKWKPKSVRSQSQKLANGLYLVKNSKVKT